MSNSEINLLKKLIGLKDIWLYTSQMTILWEKSAIVPNFSIQCGKKWIIFEPVIEGIENSYIEWNRIDVYQADTPKDANYVLIEGGHKALNRPLSSIDFPRPYVVTSMDVYKFATSGPAKGSETVEYYGCIVFNFEDGRSFAISSYKAPSGTLEFTMDKTEIEKLTGFSSQRSLIG